MKEPHKRVLQWFFEELCLGVYWHIPVISVVWKWRQTNCKIAWATQQNPKGFGRAVVVVHAFNASVGRQRPVVLLSSRADRTSQSNPILKKKKSNNNKGFIFISCIWLFSLHETLVHDLYAWCQEAKGWFFQVAWKSLETILVLNSKEHFEFKEAFLCLLILSLKMSITKARE